MSFMTIAIRKIEVIGRIWQPCMGVCGMTYSLDRSDVKNIRALGGGQLTRDAVQGWLETNAGDFQSIIDFHADIEEFDSPWVSEDNECTFLNCTYPEG
jgi:hypothetical protein